VVLWFGSWKNGFSSYAPAWVKKDTKRFRRSVSAEGDELDILSTLGTETVKSDGRAFSELLKHIREKDQEQQTVLMVQIENEVGYLGRGRDRSSSADRLFRSPVPPDLILKLENNRDSFSPELRAHFNAAGRTWTEVFGDAADEVFMAWNYARYIQSVAAQGKHAYPLPMYVNCQLPAPAERAGEYPSGAPIRTTWRFTALPRPRSTSTRRIFTGPISNTGSIGTSSRGTRYLSRKRGSKAHPITHSTRMEKRGRLAFLPSGSTVCRSPRCEQFRTRYQGCI
jgi:hypothetical protein